MTSESKDNDKDMDWNLVDHGDGVEQLWWPKLKNQFARYEAFWIEYVRPLTYRPKDIFVRETVPKPLALLATASYGTFFHLVGCHQQLELVENGDSEAFSHERIYAFYSRLFSVGCAVHRFFIQVGTVLQKYEPAKFPAGYSRNLDLRLPRDRMPGVRDHYQKFRKFFVDQSPYNYRNQQVHDWGFPIIRGRIPKHEYFSNWAQGDLKEKGLGAIASFLRTADAQDVFDREFVEPLRQAKEDLNFAQKVIDRIWIVAFVELEQLKSNAKYQNDRDKGKDLDPPPRVECRISSRADFDTSGTV
jgi:hypothetical protein